MKKVWLQDMTWEEVDEAIKRGGGVILIPVGSVEQHAWHLMNIGRSSFYMI